MVSWPFRQSGGGIVVSGEVGLTVGERTAILKTDDAGLFNSQEPHRFRNVGDHPATVISACAPPCL
ncbi:MAG: cupin domain-containing protein [Rhodobacteraceae bacterium]|nr:cupin domain-containing protein [Paracoccaceae bacterium]MCB2151279.1 cupin domain-containing protein [Paracoccaceae bacterium]MCB2158322.1 cupin domain-containing protein [Paracoccaceae bacterium]